MFWGQGTKPGKAWPGKGVVAEVVYACLRRISREGEWGVVSGVEFRR